MTAQMTSGAEHSIKTSISNITSRANVTEKLPMDWVLFAVVIVLTLIGLVMSYSTTFYNSAALRNNPFAQFENQLTYAGIGLVFLVILSRFDYGFWHLISPYLAVLTIVALGAVLAFGDARFGAKRAFLGGSIQPSEAAKITILLYAATWLSSRRDELGSLLMGVAPFVIILAIGTVTILFEPDLSTTVIILIAAFAMFFVAGARIHHLLIVLGIAVLLATTMMNAPVFTHVAARMRDYLVSMQGGIPHEQIQQAMAAFREGGLLGVGVGGGFAKYFLYTAHTDSVFAVLADETGLLGLAVTLGLFIILVYRAFRIAQRSDSYMGAYWAIGLSTWIIMQTLLNSLAMVGLIPLPGIPVPFLSIGGSSLISVLSACGILLSISRGSPKMARTEVERSMPKRKNELIAGGRANHGASSIIRRRYSRSRTTRPDRSGAAEDDGNTLIGRDVKFKTSLGKRSAGSAQTRLSGFIRRRAGRNGTGSGQTRGR